MLLSQVELPLLRASELLSQTDPTGLSSGWGRLVIIAILLTVLIMALRFLRDRRNR